jgi:hypothetical protein
MNKQEWMLKETWKAKRQGYVWVVENREGDRGYFKFTTRSQWYYAGPMVANEWVAAALARQLGFPVAKLEIAAVRGPDGRVRKGIVSVEERAAEVVTWRNAAEDIRRRPEEYVNQINYLCGLVVFDAWIANIDRAMGKNLILYRNQMNEKYNWYLIDHGHALYGSPRKWKRGPWDAPLWQKLWRFYHVPQGLLRLQSSLPALESMIKRIQSLDRTQIDAALHSVPKGFLKEKERMFMRRMLLQRQKQVGTMMKRWIAYKGTKEYNNKETGR